MNLVPYSKGNDNNDTTLIPYSEQTHGDDELKQLKIKVDEKKNLIHRLQFASNALNDKEDMKKSLGRQLEKEERDVEKLESNGIASFVSGIFGNKEKKIAKEREEAERARNQYDICCQEVESIAREVENYRSQLTQFDGIEEQYRNLLEQKREVILNNNVPSASEVYRLMDEQNNCSRILRELNEAIIAGNNALGALRALEGALEDAKSCGVWDMMGGGFLADSAKYSHLDEAKRISYDVRDLIGRFQRELKDVNIDFHFDIRIDSFDRFADFMFDNAWTDMSVQGKINDSLNQVKYATKNVNSVLSNLESSIMSLNGDIETLNEKIEEEIIEVNL